MEQTPDERLCEISFLARLAWQTLRQLYTCEPAALAPHSVRSLIDCVEICPPDEDLHRPQCVEKVGKPNPSVVPQDDKPCEPLQPLPCLVGLYIPPSKLLAFPLELTLLIKNHNKDYTIPVFTFLVHFQA